MNLDLLRDCLHGTEHPAVRLVRGVMIADTIPGRSDERLAAFDYWRAAASELMPAVADCPGSDLRWLCHAGKEADRQRLGPLVDDAYPDRQPRVGDAALALGAEYYAETWPERSACAAAFGDSLIRRGCERPGLLGPFLRRRLGWTLVRYKTRPARYAYVVGATNCEPWWMSFPGPLDPALACLDPWSSDEIMDTPGDYWRASWSRLAGRWSTTKGAARLDVEHAPLLTLARRAAEVTP